MMLTLLFAVLLCLYPLLSFCSACNLPTANDPFSVCAYCSDKHAGVRWMMHDSNRVEDALYYPDQYDEIKIEFQCRDPENGTVFNRDDCFDLSLFLSTTNPGKWQWHILERELIEGTECNFTATVENSVFRKKNTLSTSTCTVKECSEDFSTDCLTSPIPAVCPGGEVGDSDCSCSCRDGFSETRSWINTLLICENINECENEAHQIECGGVTNCVDTEGGYFCLPNSTSSTVSIQPTTITPTLTPSSTIIVGTVNTATTVPSSSNDTSILVSQSVIIAPNTAPVIEPDTSILVSQSVIIAPNTAPVIEPGADIRVLIAIPLSVTVLIVLVLISLMFVIALNRYHGNDSVNKMITSWQNHDKFDPKFIPAVEIDKKLSVNKSLESIIAPLENCTSARGEHVLSTGQDAERESTLSYNTAHTVPQPDETTDSGVILSSGQSSSNYQDANTSPVSAHTDDLVEYSSSSSSDLSEHKDKRMHNESQEHNKQALVHPSVSGASGVCCSLNSIDSTSAGSGDARATKPGDEYVTLYGSQVHAEHYQVHPTGGNTAVNSVGWTFSSLMEPETGIIDSDLDFGTPELLTCTVLTGDHVHQQGQNSIIDISGTSLEQDKTNEVDMALTLDGSTNDHLNTNTNSIEHNISVTDHATQSQVTSENVGLDTQVKSHYIIHKQQVPTYTINQAQYQTYGGWNTGVTDIALVSDIGGSSLSLVWDTEY